MKLRVTASAGLALSAVAIPATALPAALARVPDPETTTNLSTVADRTAKFGGRQVDYLQAGSGATTIVLLMREAALARDIQAFEAAFGARGVGHEIGGMVAYAYARLDSGELAGVAILDVPLPGIAP